MGDLSPEEIRLFEAIDQKDYETVAELVENVNINCIDKSGMNPIDQACFRGDADIVRFLIENGGDVDNRKHPQGYTCLMFAALAGKPNICQMLLSAGARADAVNSIGKTASELAAFVGQHECVSVISSYIDAKEIERILHPQGDKSEEIYPKEFVTFIHDLTKTHDFHPVRIILNIMENAHVLEHEKKLLFVVDMLFERQLRTKESNESQSLKLWIILFILREVFKFVDSKKEENKEPKELLDIFMKNLLVQNPEDLIKKNSELLLRNAMPEQNQSFYQQYDPITGKMEWKVVENPTEDDEDMIIQIARSNFGDMIWDYDRNEKFSKGLKYFIEKLKKERKTGIHVVDIGTGTGLLSMMAAKHGADKVTAVEVFDPMAKTAEKIVKKNNLDGTIKVIHSRSTDVDERHVSEKGDIIVAEVFDTELIGEGALRSFKEGLQTFGKPGCRVVPSKGKIWICPIYSKEIQKFIKLPKKTMKAPFDDCPGTGAVFDVQFSEFPNEWFKVLAEPFVAFDFNFEDAESIIYKEQIIREFEAVTDGIFNTILFWWDLDMDGTGSNIISTIPEQFSDQAVWRDHWMQAIYFLPEPINVKEGDEVSVICAHDEYSLWFGIPDGKKKELTSSICSCQLHCTFSRYDFYRMNWMDENSRFINFIQNLCNGKTVVTFGDGSLISLYASKLAKIVYSIETGFSSARMIQGYAKMNSLTNIHVSDSIEKFYDRLKDEKNVIVLAEPFFSTSILPWHAMVRYLHLIEGIQNIFGNGMHLDIYPSKAKLLCMPVCFKHLWKIAAPVGIVDGFDLTDFDEICQKAREIADPIVEQHSLFEYPSVSTGEPIEILDFNDCKQVKKNIIRPVLPGTNALVFWVEYKLKSSKEEIKLSNGLLEESKIGKILKWNPGYRQGVYFIPKSDIEKIKGIRVEVNSGEIDLDFKFESIF
uniref:Protein arginine N-methyltransferase n=1 Tax=Panagrolaimus sp. JU765 TaxID=591449 RepID=A0AC34QQN8_9BILA